LLRIKKGTDFTYYKQTTIRRRILRRMALSNKENPPKYLEFLRENKSEQDVLYQDLLIPVTSFFRDTEIFSNLCETLLPDILENKTGDGPIRVWVAGCSTGQEAYTIAMCMLEFLDEQESQEKVQLFGTDISEPAILKARSGIYKRSEIEDISPERLERFFNKIDSSYQIKKEVREKCVFANHNFLKDPPFGRMDLISCRNVLIYMQPYLQKKALTTFHYALKKKGSLFLGKSETVNSVPDLFTPSEKKDKIFTRKDKAGKFMQVASKRSEENFRDFSKSAKTENARTDFQRTADDVILSKYTPAGVVIDEAMEIVHFRGSTGAYLEPQAGKPSLNLLKMAKNGLAFELRTIIHHAKKEGESILKENVPLRDNNKQRLISLEAIPLLSLTEPHYLILFHDLSTDPRFSQKLKDKKITSEQSKTDGKDLRIDQLEKELVQTREDMRSITEDQEATNEELQSANEELQSGSEELQTLNEELETSKEELQSTNEELTSVNQELLSLNKNLTTARNFAVDILNTVREAWVVLDKKFHVRSASSTFYKVFRTSEKETENKSIFSLGSDQWHIPQLRNLLEKILPEKSFISDFEVTHDFPEIGERTMLLNAREIVRDEGGEKLILLVFGDITDKRTAEKNIEKSEIKFRLLAETIPQLIWITNAEGQFEYFNPKWKHYTGTSSNDSLENKWIKFVHPEDLPSVLDTWKESLKKGSFFSMEYRLKNKKGEYNWFLAKALPLFGTDGEIIKWFGSYTNIEIQKEAEQALRKSSEHFRELSELVPEKISHADFNGKFEYFNKSWIRYTGLNVEELKDGGWQGLLHPEEKEEVVKQWRATIETGQPFEMELRYLNKDGNYNWHLSRAIPVKDKEGRIKQWIGAATEIQRIKEEEKRKEGFLQLVSHELKTPVTSIKGYVQLLLSMLESEKKQPMDLPLKPSLRRIEDQVGRLTRLISEMLDLSRIEENKLELKKEIFRLNELVDNTVQDINNTDIEHNINVYHEFHCEINADRDRIGQVIINFITNAVKYSPHSREIAVTIHEAEAGKVAVSVKDRGIGIAEADQKEIFKRFHRVPGKNEDTYAGLGIGLFVAHEIVERHDGSITVESKLEEGSVFTFILPYESKNNSEN
ncbi:CheR family methyltransferase, partial [Autumnicola edwardsiae]